MFAALLAAFVPGAPAQAAGPPVPVNTMIQACRTASVVLIAARGSGEGANQNYGLGPTMWSAYSSMYDEIKNHGFNGQELRVVPVIYDAQPVWSLPFVVQGQNAFFRSIAVGIQNTKSLLDDYRSRPECAGKPLILAGYSQGAMVMHRVLNDSHALRQVNVWTPLLVADGDRVANDRVARWGGADPAKQGIGQYFPAISGSNNAKSNNPGFIRDVCAPLDVVCSPEFGARPWWCNGACVAAWQAGVLAGQIWVHQQYANSTALDQAARAIPR
ncbi:cutinase family protein [Nocardia asteroides]|uniref:cutinase family protein n=1 Tax=Nocardia asteroides TaxID=1824 RepID=UPI001E3475D9|nr:cutinase family protein [Nocardia asteroides]UGT60350.1 cutinase family protein [Nocardia asteroides]